LKGLRNNPLRAGFGFRNIFRHKLDGLIPLNFMNDTKPKQQFGFVMLTGLYG